MPVKGRTRFNNYGMLWARGGKELKFYYNGRQIMKIYPRRPLQEKLHMIFDTEVFPFAQNGIANIGLPRVGHLTNNNHNTMFVEFVRTWKLVKKKKKKGKKELTLGEETIGGSNNNNIISPNPFVENYVELQGTDDVDVEVYDLQGKIVPSRITLGVDENSVIIEFEDSVGPGTYFIKTTNGKTFKILKN